METQKAEEPKTKAMKKDGKPVDRLAELRAKKAEKEREHKHLSDEESDELRGLEKEAEELRRRGALIHKFCAESETYARKQAQIITRQVTDKVAQFGKSEKEEIERLHDSHREKVLRTKKEFEDRERFLRAEQRATVQALEAKFAEASASIRDRYRDLFHSAEVDLQNQHNEIGSLIEDFQRELKELSLGELESLSADGVLSRGRGVFLVVPGANKD